MAPFFREAEAMLILKAILLPEKPVQQKNARLRMESVPYLS